MKPNWQDAPEWANYLAKDEDEGWAWHEALPYKKEDVPYGNEGYWSSAGQKLPVLDVNYIHWEYSLEKRNED